MKVAILSGSVYGTAEEVARHAERVLNNAGFVAWHNPRASLADVQAFAPQAFLAVTSTTGMGELPDNLQPLYYAIRDHLPAWSGLPGGVIALGDSSYGDTFCGGGELVLHSKVLACQGLAGATLPANRLQKKLMTKTICERIKRIAISVMKTFNGSTGFKKSYWVGLAMRRIMPPKPTRCMGPKIRLKKANVSQK